MSSLTTTVPVVSCLNLPHAEYRRRTLAAQALVIKFDSDANETEWLASEVLWSDAFWGSFPEYIVHMPLYQIGAWFDEHRIHDYDDSRPFDFWDYCYIADVLREAIVDNTIAQTFCLERALAWVEQTGLTLLARPAALAPAAVATSASIMTASAA